MKSMDFKRISAYLSAFALLFVSLFTLSACENIEDTWLHQAEDGQKYYYTFSDDGKLEITHGTNSYMCTYNVEKNVLETDYLNGNVYNGNFLGTYKYEIVSEDDEEFLVLVEIDGEKHKLKSVEKPDMDFVLKPYDNFKTDRKLTGNWEYNYDDFGMSLKLTVSEDGTMILNLADIEYQNYVYTVDSSSLKFTRYTDRKIEEIKPYKVTDAGLEFLGITWTKS